MLEGLEISEVFLSVVKKESYSYRWDSTYFLKEFIFSPLENTQTDLIENLFNIKSGSTPRDRDAELKEGVILLKTNDIRNNVLKDKGDSFFYIDTYTNSRMKATQLKPNDVLINIVGATTDVIGRVSFVSDSFPKANITQAMSLMRAKQQSVLPHYLFCFLLSKYGNMQVRRFARPTGQYNMNHSELGCFEIPLLSIDFQNELTRLISNNNQLDIKSKQVYNQAENLLLETLGLENFQPGKEPVNVKTFSDSFGSSGRLDAEYYQVKYDNLEEAIIKYSNYSTIGNIRTDNFRGLQPEYVEDGELDVINSKHILENTLDYGNFEKTSIAYWESQKRARVFKGDILTYTTGANIGRTQVYLIENKALASNHVNILRLKEGYNSFYVGFVMNSIIGRMQTEKFSAGSAQAELYPKDIDQFIIPFCSDANQSKIMEQIEESFKLKRQSEHLLEVAKTAVEMAIEQDEETAIAFINDNMN